jgi:hypothetical protein
MQEFDDLYLRIRRAVCHDIRHFSARVLAILVDEGSKRRKPESWFLRLSGVSAQRFNSLLPTARPAATLNRPRQHVDHDR